MADIRIKDLTTEAPASVTSDFLPIDGNTGTRKLSAYSPSFGGNATVGGTLTVTGATSVAANLKSSVSASGSTGGILLAENTAALATGNQASVFFPTSTGASTYWQLIGRQNSSTANDQTLRVVFGGVAQHTYFNASDLSTQSGITLKVLDTTASTSTSSGALVVGNGTSGGLGVGGAINAGGIIKGAQNVYVSAGLPAGINTTAFQVDVENATERNIVAFGDSSRAGLITGAHDGSGRATWKFGRYTTSFAEYVRITGVAATDAVLSIYGTTASTSTSSGALVVSGGVGVAGAIYAGGSLNVASSSTALTSLGSSTSGATGYNQASFTLDSGGTPKTAVLGVQDTGAFVGTNTNHDVTIRTNTTTRVTVSSSDVTIASGVGLKLGNAYASGAPTATGYVVIKDSTGTSYKIPAVAL